MPIDTSHNIQNDSFPIHLSDLAYKHFLSLIEKEAIPNMNIRVSVLNPKTSKAEVFITFCPYNEEEKDDLKLNYSDFKIFIEKKSLPFLQDATIDYKANKVGGELSIKAPHLKKTLDTHNLSLFQAIEDLILNEINPSLASHGGKVTLIDIIEPNILILEFGGGCQGCGMVGYTLKHGIEKTLKEHFPQITEIKDVTDHEAGTNPYM
ncbi:MAG: Fe/S biosis protein NfuA [Francisellaceae bacterium]|nr:Fe/S biosis protein NfuA [Francisellaceae bacterium]